MNRHKPADATLTPVRVKRPVSLSVPGDLALYAALTGKIPEIDPTLAQPMKAATVARQENPWSPMVLSIYLRQICKEKALMMNRPELAGWIRRQSENARKRISETKVRVIAARKDKAA